MIPAPDTGQKLLGELLGLIAALPPDALADVVRLVRALRTSRDPARAVRLALAVAASKRAGTLAIERLIGK